MPVPQSYTDIQGDSNTISADAYPTPSPTPPPTPVNAMDLDVQDPYSSLSMFFIHESYDSEFWWKTTGKVFSQMMKRAFYSLDQQYKYLMFYYFTIIPELGPSPPPFPAAAPKQSANSPYTHFSKSKSKRGVNISSMVKVNVPKPVYRSYMTDDHTPIELSWQFGADGGVVARFAIDPVLRQSSSADSRGAISVFEDLSSLEVIAPGVDLNWCRTCANTLTVSNVDLDRVNSVSQYPSQYFVGFDFSSQGVVLKAYFLPATKSALTGISKHVLVTQCINELSKQSSSDLKTPWLRVSKFFKTLPLSLTPDINIVAVDCVPSKQNRVKVYCRSPLATLSNLRRFITLGCFRSHHNSNTRDIVSDSSPLSRGLHQITLLWYLLFPDMANSKYDNTEPLMKDPSHPTAGLLFYYELREGHSEPFPKVYIPVRHLCRSDRHIVKALTRFYHQTGNIKAGMRYAQDVQEIFSHRQLSQRSGIHTYITVAIKESNIEVTSYFNPECYSAERQKDIHHHNLSRGSIPGY